MRISLVIIALLSSSAFATDFPIGSFTCNTTVQGQVFKRTVEVSEASVGGVSLPVISIEVNDAGNIFTMRGIGTVQMAKDSINHDTVTLSLSGSGETALQALTLDFQGGKLIDAAYRNCD